MKLFNTVFHQWQLAAVRRRMQALEKENAKLDRLNVQFEAYAVNLRKRLAERGEWMKTLQDCLAQKNIDMDALHWVWCSGCGGKDVTEEMVLSAEQNTKRLRTQFNNKEYRKAQKEQTDQ